MIIGNIRGTSHRYHDGSESLEIWIHKDKADGLPFVIGDRVEIRLKIGNNEYLSGLRATENNDYVWISPDLYDPNGHKLSLSSVLTGEGFQKNETVLLEIDDKKIQVKKHDSNNEMIIGRENFNKLLKNKKWREECTKLTIHRQNQLAKIFDKYDGERIPFSHFTDEIIKNPELKNSEAYPAVCAFICGILNITGDYLSKPTNLVWGKEIISEKDVNAFNYES